MTEILKNLITDFVALNFGWGVWLLFIFAVIGAVVLINKVINFAKTVFARRKKKQTRKKGTK